MKPQIPELTGQIAQAGVITPEDILTLRRSVWADGEINAAEAEAIFALNDLIATPTPEWSAFFIEALSAWLVDQEHPRGYIDEVQAGWLIARIERSGPHHSLDDIELVVHCLEKAESAPPSLAQFALAHVEAAVLAKSDGSLPHITTSDAALLRRLIFAPGSHHPGSVGQAEAEMLWRLKDATCGGDNAPEWQDLFVKGVGNYLQGFSSPEPLSREREAELEDFINRPAAGIGSFFQRMAEAPPAMIKAELKPAVKPARWFGKKPGGLEIRPGVVPNFFGNKPLVFAPYAPKNESRAIDPAQQNWLDRHIQTDNQIDPLERALLEFLKTA